MPNIHLGGPEWSEGEFQFVPPCATYYLLSSSLSLQVSRCYVADCLSNTTFVYPLYTVSVWRRSSEYLHPPQASKGYFAKWWQWEDSNLRNLMVSQELFPLSHTAIKRRAAEPGTPAAQSTPGRGTFKRNWSDCSRAVADARDGWIERSTSRKTKEISHDDLTDRAPATSLERLALFNC